MKNVWSLTCALAFVSVVGFAQTPGVAPLPSEVLAAILSPPAVADWTTCPTSQGEILFAAEGLGGGVSPSPPPICEELCPPFGTVSDCCRCHGGTPQQCEWACG